MFSETYEDAVKNLNKLRYQPYAYSTDNDESTKLKAKKDEESFKTQILSVNMASELMKSSQINLTNTDAKTNRKWFLYIIPGGVLYINLEHRPFIIATTYFFNIHTN